jgi:hypothetical protein
MAPVKSTAREAGIANVIKSGIDLVAQNGEASNRKDSCKVVGVYTRAETLACGKSLREAKFERTRSVAGPA